MLTFEQLKTLLLIRVRAGTLFSRLDKTAFTRIISMCDYDPDVDKALLHAAYARKEDVAALLAMLEVNPRLLLQPGNVITPGGLEVQRVTIYEFLLGAGDPDFAEMVAPFFKKIPDGEAERERQLARYRPHLEGMLTQKPYDIDSIFNLMLNPKNPATIHADVRALLEMNLKHPSELRDAILAFKDFHLPKKPLTKPQMHFNYATQNALYQMLYDDVIWSKLYKASENNNEMIDLVWRQMIGYLMNFYPGIDRCMAAQGIGNIYNEAGTQVEDINRSYTLRYSKMNFPVFGAVTDIGTLGDHFGISLLGRRRGGACATPQRNLARSDFQSLCRAKSSKLPSIYAATPATDEISRKSRKRIKLS